MAKQHSFDIEVAKQYGILEAVIINNLSFWIDHNAANETNYYDGCYWTFNSARAFSELMPYASSKQIRRALDHLKDEGIIQTGNYNKSSYDRTLWYAFTEKGLSILPNGKMEVLKWENENDQMGTPIPDINTDEKPKIKNIDMGSRRFQPPTIQEVQEYCTERGNGINAEQFVDYYSARGWELSKGRKIKDWMACVRTWERNGFNSKPKQETKKQYSDEDLEYAKRYGIEL